MTYLQLLPQEGVTLAEHLQHLEANGLSLAAFEHMVVDFLTTLLHAQPQPLLAQIEHGESFKLAASFHRSIGT